MFDQSFVKSKIKQLRSSAKKRNIVFDLTARDLSKLIEESVVCFYFKTPLDLNNFSIDRKDCKKGYIKSNVVLCSKKANNLKNQLFENDATKLSNNELINFLISLNILKN